MCVYTVLCIIIIWYFIKCSAVMQLNSSIDYYVNCKDSYIACKIVDCIK